MSVFALAAGPRLHERDVELVTHWALRVGAFQLCQLVDGNASQSL